MNKLPTLLLFIFYSSIAVALPNNQHITNYTRQLLDVMKWDRSYEQERQKDMAYLLGNIDGEEVANLSLAQKEQVISLMRAAVLKQMMKDKEYFKNFLISQYDEFFTIDELKKLIAYYKTPAMQLVIDSKIEKKQVTVEQIEAKLATNKKNEAALSAVSSSYLKPRFVRFQGKINPRLNKMIYERMQEVLGAVFKEIPQYVQFVSHKS